MQKFLSRLEWKMNRFAVRDLMKYLCLAMLGVFVLDYLPLSQSASSLLYFSRGLIMQGQVWRMITFAVLPPSGHLFWILISLYFYYFIGTALENRWGSARFNLYYLTGILGNVIAGFITGYASNQYLNLTLLLAFAFLYPEQEFTVMFFLPVKAKWFGLLSAGALLYFFFATPGLAVKAGIVFSLLPFLLFLGKDAMNQGKLMARRIGYQIRKRM